MDTMRVELKKAEYLYPCTPLATDPMKLWFRKTKERIRHSLNEHVQANIIVDEAEAFLRRGVRAEPDFEYRERSQFTGEPAFSATDVSTPPSFTQHQEMTASTPDMRGTDI
jgi:hypothetical protein